MKEKSYSCGVSCISLTKACSSFKEMVTNSSTTQPVPEPYHVGSVVGGASTIAFFLLFFLWITRRKVVKRKRPKSGAEIFQGFTHQATVQDILRQLACACKADRVTLGVFHNGQLGMTGTHYTKMCVLGGYNAPGIPALKEIGRDIQSEVLISELRPLFESEGEIVLSRTEAPEECKRYLEKRDIHALWNRILYCGGRETAIISFHWCGGKKATLPPLGSELEGKVFSLLESLENLIMRIRSAA
jgi:hypothetical protein